MEYVFLARERDRKWKTIHFPKVFPYQEAKLDYLLFKD